MTKDFKIWWASVKKKANEPLPATKRGTRGTAQPVATWEESEEARLASEVRMLFRRNESRVSSMKGQGMSSRLRMASASSQFMSISASRRSSLLDPGRRQQGQAGAAMGRGN